MSIDPQNNFKSGDDETVILRKILDRLSNISANSGGGGTSEGMVPVGAIIAWNKSFANTPTLSANFVECNGQILSDSGSVYNGQTIPNLNGGNRFLRGNSTSGTLNGAATHTHTVDLSTNLKPVEDFSAIPSDVPFPGLYNTSAASSLPPCADVVWIMRVK